MYAKDKYWQGVRGLGALAVIFIHCKNGLECSAGWQIFWFVERAAINFPVCLFLFISGYFIRVDSLISGGYKSFLKKRITKILIPYITWSLIYVMIDVTAGMVSGNISSVSGYFVDIMTGGGAPQLYFCIVLLQLIVLTPFLARCINDRFLTTALLCISPLYSLILSVLSIQKGVPPRSYSMPFIAWVSIYYFGMLVKNREDLAKKIRTKKTSSLIKAALLFIVVQVIVSCFMKSLNVDLAYAVSQNKFSSMLYAIIIILIFAKGSFGRLVEKFCWLGDLSYGIFFSHYIIIYGLKVIANIPNGFFEIWRAFLPTVQIVEMTVVTLLSILLVKTLAKISRRNRFIGMLLGL